LKVISSNNEVYLFTAVDEMIAVDYFYFGNDHVEIYLLKSAMCHFL